MKERIQTIRKKRGLTMSQFADRIGSTVSSISCYELGKRVPSNAVITAICKEFRINYDWLVYGRGEMEDKTSDSLTSAVVSKVNDLPEHIKTLVRALAEMDTEWYEKLDKVITRLESEKSGEG